MRTLPQDTDSRRFYVDDETLVDERRLQIATFEERWRAMFRGANPEERIDLIHDCDLSNEIELFEELKGQLETLLDLNQSRDSAEYDLGYLENNEGSLASRVRLGASIGDIDEQIADTRRCIEENWPEEQWTEIEERWASAERKARSIRHRDELRAAVVRHAASRVRSTPRRTSHARSSRRMVHVARTVARTASKTTSTGDPDADAPGDQHAALLGALIESRSRDTLSWQLALGQAVPQ